MKARNFGQILTEVCGPKMPVVKTAAEPFGKSKNPVVKFLNESFKPDELGLLDLAQPLGVARFLRGKRVYHGTRSGAETYSDQAKWLNKAINYVRQHFTKDEIKKIASERRKTGAVSADVPDEVIAAQQLAKEGKVPIAKPKLFKHFDPLKEGKGGGGNAFGKGIYLTDEPKVASGYGMIRVHNLPPQTRILDIHEPVTDEFIDRVAKVFRANKNLLKSSLRDVKDVTPAQLLERFVPNAVERYHEIIPELGYDAISYNPGTLTGASRLFRGKKNYVVFNYDVINNPRKFAQQRMIESLIEGTGPQR